MVKGDDYYGHLTHVDGSHTMLSSDEAKALWEECEEARRKRAESMPTFLGAMSAISDAQQRMTELGWRPAIYCPKDRSRFAVVQFGSTGIFAGRYRGEWPEGWIDLGDESMRPEGGLWKSLSKLTDDENNMLDSCAADHAAWIERMGKMA